MPRTQITLTDEQHRRLKEESIETGLSMSELIRRRLDGGPTTDDRVERRAAAEAAFGSAGPDDFDGLSGKEYVEKIRGPGLGVRLARMERESTDRGRAR